MKSAIRVLEQTWGRPITGQDCERIIANLETFTSMGCKDPDSIIIEAIKKADLAGARSMRYIEAILLEWQKKGIITIAQIEADDERFQRSKNKNQPTKIIPTGKYDDLYL